jgi:hypothetical protein
MRSGGKSGFLAFRGYFVVIVTILVAITVVMMANQNPKATKEDPKETQAPGDLVAHIVWPNGDTDVDLWLDGPGELAPVGYSNKGGLLWNLLRDDLGSTPDATPINYEDAFTRGILPGEYTINVQCFECSAAEFPMEVAVAVSKRSRIGNQDLSNIINTKVILRADGQEKTAVRFTLNDDLSLDTSSVNNVYREIRGQKDNSPKPSMYSGPGSIPEQFRGDK